MRNPTWVIVDNNAPERRYVRAATVEAAVRAYFGDEIDEMRDDDSVRFAAYVVGTVKRTKARIPADSSPRQWHRDGEMGPPEVDGWMGPSNPVEAPRDVVQGRAENPVQRNPATGVAARRHAALAVVAGALLAAAAVLIVISTEAARPTSAIR